MKRPLLIGLTGSIGMGKSETAKMFQKLGVPVYDSDAAVHRLYDKGGRAVAAIAQAFPATVRENKVDRAALSKAVAGRADGFAVLERIVHPLVAADEAAFLAQHKDAPMVVLDVPLLIEAPHLLFPFARRIVADCVRDGGMPPLMIEPIDFASLYRARMEQGGETVGNA